MRISGIHKSFGTLKVLDGVSIDVTEGMVTAILGPSGCGKTTLLRICAGLVEPDQAPDASLVQLRSQRAAFLFQEPRLLPWDTAAENVELVLQDLAPQDRRSVASRLLDEVGLSGYGGYYPPELSGGMKQRVAMARCFAYPAAVLYMDEPFQGLDLELKLSLFDTFRSLNFQEPPPGDTGASGPRTVIFVTHDVTEAALLGDHVYVFSPRPATVRHRVDNPVPMNERALQNAAVRDFEGQLYGMILTQG